MSNERRMPDLQSTSRFHEYGEDVEGILINGCLIYADIIESIEEKPSISILRATETWQQTGAYYVRIQAMAKKHHITLRQEFDEHDTPDTKYIVVTDNDFPIATARLRADFWIVLLSRLRMPAFAQ